MPPLSVCEALELILAQVCETPVERMPASEAVGCRLAEDVASDLDSPPYDKSTVDGFAVRSEDAAAGRRTLAIVEQIAAGVMPRHTLAPGQTARIMTGAPLPDGADAVVMVEHTAAGRWMEGETVQLSDRPVRAGQNILRRAQSMACGQVVLPAGRAIRPVEVGLLAEVGVAQVAVQRRPRVALLATGDELVTAHERPRGAQIRNSNGPLLRALAVAAGASAVELGIARDDEEDLRRHIGRALADDVLVLSGGVSAGLLDLVPQLLKQQGFECLFHKVQLRPGKPLWFGVRRVAGHTTLAFGLPGNPVSGLVCWELFVKPALLKMRLGAAPAATEVAATLVAPHEQRGDRPTYWPAFLEEPASAVAPHVRLLNWQGSGDLRTLSDANALAVFPAGDRRFEAGATVPVRRL
ncbi:MAG: gephyrin-like molybdotransferase Glp [Pirellulales bacterium]